MRNVEEIYDADDGDQDLTERELYYTALRDLHVTTPLLNDAHRLARLNQDVYLYKFNPRGFFHNRLHMGHRVPETAYEAESNYFFLPEMHWLEAQRALKGEKDELVGEKVPIDLEFEQIVAQEFAYSMYYFIANEDGVPRYTGSGGKKLPKLKPSAQGKLPGKLDVLVIGEVGDGESSVSDRLMPMEAYKYFIRRREQFELRVPRDMADFEE